jgi:hypothetical protein
VTVRQELSKRQLPTRPQSVIVKDTLADLRKAQKQLVDYGVRIPDNSRIDQAIAVLEHAQETGKLVPAHRGDDLGLRALELAFDYSAIGDSLPPDAVASVRRELRDSLVGSLDGQSNNGQPIQLQSQYVARAALVRGGLTPLHPTHSTRGGRKSPDLYVENGIAVYPIEAKRPRLSKNVLPRLEDARDQLADYGEPGAIIVDITDCVRGLLPSQIDDQVQHTLQDITQVIFDPGRGYRPGYRPIMVAGVVARAAWVSIDKGAEAQIEVHTCTGFINFASAPHTILHRHGIWLRQHFGNGYEELYRTLGEVGHTATPAT